MTKQRIEYIDAMRGFTMILVVYSHICRYCLGDWTMGWNDVFFLFRLPCFFFISGWLFDCVHRPAIEIIKRKFMVQIVPTFIFLLLLAPPPLFFSKLGTTKGGYWFTFTLFEFFSICLFSERYLKRWSGAFALVISTIAFFYDVYFNQYFRNMGLWSDALGFLSFATWRYYLFFYIGTWVRLHYDNYLRWTGKPFVYIVTIIGFFLIACHPRPENKCFAYFTFVIGGILGMTIVFCFFRYFSRFFTKERMLGRTLQYIGTRTLDIYLLHFFVLPRFLLPYGEQLRASNCRFLEFLVAIIIALMVVFLSLLGSYIIRLSPILGHYLFGVKYERK